MNGGQMAEPQESRGNVSARLRLTLTGIGGGAALGVVFGLGGVMTHWPGAWGLPPQEAARLIFLVCVGVGAFLGACVGAVLAGHLGFIGFIGATPGIAVMAYEFLGVGTSLPRGTYFIVTVPALAVLVAVSSSFVAARKPRSASEDTWWWRATWAQVRGKPLPPLPAGMLPPRGDTKKG